MSNWIRAVLLFVAARCFAMLTLAILWREGIVVHEPTEADGWVFAIPFALAFFGLAPWKAKSP